MFTLFLLCCLGGRGNSVHCWYNSAWDAEPSFHWHWIVESCLVRYMYRLVIVTACAMLCHGFLAVQWGDGAWWLGVVSVSGTVAGFKPPLDRSYIVFVQLCCSGAGSCAVDGAGPASGQLCFTVRCLLYPGGLIFLSGVVLMLGHRRGQWASIGAALGQWLLSSAYVGPVVSSRRPLSPALSPHWISVVLVSCFLDCWGVMARVICP